MASAARLARRLRDPRLRDAQTWRLISGLILFAFALTHFLNHALGHVSVQTMEEVQAVRRGVLALLAGHDRALRRARASTSASRCGS